LRRLGDLASVELAPSVMQFPPASLSPLATGGETGVHASYAPSRRARKMRHAAVHKNLQFSTAFRRIPQDGAA
jgi:hypothetical protein